MKLISMTDFVFMLRNRTTSELCKDFPRAFKMPEWNGNKSDMVKDMLAIEAIQWRLTGEYAKFLKQPLTLGMFVPCDDEGNVLEEPKQTYLTCSFFEHQQFFNKQKKYEKAKEKVLFEGFNILSNEDDIIEIECKDVFINYNKEEDLLFLDSWNGDAIIMNIECLANLINHTASNIKLTESAIKQIGL